MREQPKIASQAERYERDKVPLMFEPIAHLLLGRITLTPGERVLDIACGTGIVARLAALALGHSGQVTGVDISGDMLEVARSNALRSGASIQWRLGDAASLPVNDGVFDVVLSQQGFQYFSDQSAALREMYRVLSPGGRLALCFARAVGPESQPYQWAKASALTLHAGSEAGRKARQLAPFFHGDAKLILKMVAQEGFSNIEVNNLTVKVQMGPLDSFIHEDLFPDLANAAQTAVVGRLKRAMEPYMNGRGVEIPYGMHIVTADKV